GCLRGVNMSKGDFTFAGARYLPGLVDQFEADYLLNLETLSDLTKEKLVKHLARSHVEFTQIHPFREGNGRISRLLMDVMVAMAGREPLDYTLFTENQEFYFKSIQAGATDDYQHIERLINDTLERSSTSPAEGD
ncbi:MAG TPA: Fic family protein, partial [Candidatus Obscuribacterales bacterium]